MSVVLTSFPANASSGIRDPYPVIISPVMTSYGGQLFGYQICPIESYNASDPDAVIANHKKYGIMKRMVICVQGLVIPATYHIMNDFANDYFYGPIAAAMTLAVLFWGWLMVVGKHSAPMRDAFTVALKIGCVSLFTYVLGKSSIWPDGLFPVLINIVDEFSGIVTSYIGYSTSIKCAATLNQADVWGRVDCALNTLIGGIFDPSLLLAGLFGFFVCAFISGTFGLFVALIGFACIATLVFALLRATYVTISAYVALALMAIISPIFITCVLFSVTRAYFDKWLKLTIGFMLQPMFLFAYLSMMLAAFDTVVYDGPYSIYRALVPANVIGSSGSFRAYPARNPVTNPDGEFLIGAWLFDSGVYQEADGPAMGVGTNPRLDAHIASQNIGIGGTMGERASSTDEFKEKNAAGIVMNVLDNFKSINIYKVDIPLKRVSCKGWRWRIFVIPQHVTPPVRKRKFLWIYVVFLILHYVALLAAHPIRINSMKAWT